MSGITFRYQPYPPPRTVIYGGQIYGRGLKSSSNLGPRRVRQLTISSANDDLISCKEINKRIIAAGKALQGGDARHWRNICTTDLRNFNNVNSITALYQAATQCPPKQIPRFFEKHKQHIVNLLMKIEREGSLTETRHIANILYACAKLGVNLQEDHYPFLRKLLLSIENKLKAFKPQELAMIAWAFATLGIKNNALIDRFAQEAIEKIREFSPQNLDRMARAFAILGIKNAASVNLMNAIAKQAERRIGEFNFQGLTSMAWAFATFGIKNNDVINLMNAIARKVASIIKELTPQNLANTAWAFAKLQIDSIEAQNLLQAIETETLIGDESVKRKIDRFNDIELTQLSFAVSNLCLQRPILMAEIAEQIKAKIKHFSIRNLANCGRNFTIYYNLRDLSSDSPTTPFEHNFLEEILNEILLRKSSLCGKDSYKVHTILFYLEQVHRYPLDSSHDLLKRRTQKKIMNDGSPSSSKIHMEVHRFLENKVLGKKLRCKVLEEGFFLETVLDEEHRIAINFDGLSHFLTSGKKSGEARLKNRLLSLKGWTIIPVSAIDWDLCAKEEIETGESWVWPYIKELIQKLPSEKRTHIMRQIPPEENNHA